MLKLNRLTKFYFSVITQQRDLSYQRFVASEKILIAMFNANELQQFIFPINEDVEDKRKQMQSKPRNAFTLLSDEIKSVLENLQKGSEISQQVAKQFDQLFNPNKGISTYKSEFQFQAKRIELGQNGRQLCPLHPNSFMMNFIMNQLYEKSKQKQGILNEKGHIRWRARYIVGSPGLGKSFRFLLIKRLHDFRIAHLINHGKPLDSHFTQHFKFFYLGANMQNDKIKEIVMREVEEDFMNFPNQIKQVEQAKKKELNVFLRNVRRIYKQKNIDMRVIADQINEIYKKKLNERQQFNLNLSRMVTNTINPVIMVSSKNNPYAADRLDDPVLYSTVSDRPDFSTKNMHFQKIILDDFMTKQKRLAYSIECYLFELEKNGLSRNKAIQIMKKVSIPITTHFAVAQKIKQIFSKYGNDFVLNEQIKKQLSNISDKQALILNLNQSTSKAVGLTKGAAHQDSALKQTKETYLGTVGNILRLSIRERKTMTVSVKFAVLNQQNAYLFIEKKAKIIYLQIQEKYKNQFFRVASNLNFFSTFRQNQKDYLLFNYPPQSFDELQLLIAPYVDITFARELLQYCPEAGRSFLKGEVPFLFEYKICALFKKLYESNLGARVTINNVNKQAKEYVLKGEGRQWNEQPLIDLSIKQKNKNLKENQLIKLENSLTQKSNFLRTVGSNPIFDIVLSNFQNGNLSLLLMNLTISTQNKFTNQKVETFKNKLPNNQNFRDLMVRLNKNENIKNIQILCYVLKIKKVKQLTESQNGQNFQMNKIDGNVSDERKQIEKKLADKKQQRIKPQNYQVIEQAPQIFGEKVSMAVYQGVAVTDLLIQHLGQLYREEDGKMKPLKFQEIVKNMGLISQLRSVNGFESDI